MPASPATPQSRRPSNKHHSESTPTKEKIETLRVTPAKEQNGIKKIDIGPQKGKFDTASVRAKVYKWQVQDGGVVPVDEKVTSDDGAQDVGPTSSSDTKPPEQTPSTPKSDLKASQSPKPESANTAKARKVLHNELSPDIKTASAPKKRVVSDGHWVRHKGSSRITVVPATTSKQTPSKTKQSVERIESGDSKDQPSLPSPAPNTKRPSSKSSTDGEKMRARRSPPRTDGHDRRKTRSSEHRRRRNSHEKESRSSSQGSAASPLPPPPIRIKGQRSTRKRSRRLSQAQPHEDELDNLETPIIREPSPQRPERSDTPETKPTTLKKKVPPEKVRHTSPLPKEPDPAPVFSNRIEAWLTDAFDPFVDEKDSPPRQSATSDFEKPSRSRRHRSPRDDEANSDGGKLPKDGDVARDLTVRRRSRAPKSASDESSSKAGLKRSGAKRSVQSPTRDRASSSPREDTKALEDVVTIAPSSIDSSTENNWREQPQEQPQISRKRFPTTGKRLSTIASVETFHTRHQHVAPPSVSETSETTAKPPVDENTIRSEDGDSFDPNSITGVKGQSSNLKRKLTTHADLMSVLSLPKAGNKSIMSARSIRTNRSRLANATIGDLMSELETDEIKYMRELKTLVDGVIPVLLTCVLSKSDSILAAGLFSRASSANDSNITKPIVDMGIALERLKATHKRIPLNSPDLFLSWAQGAQKVYADYLAAWRLGFQDVVVNLAPATEEQSKAAQATARNEGWDEGLPRNEEGYVVNGDGERVDVAFLLKRPLVRIKYLAKTLKGINIIKPSPQAEDLATRYTDLVAEARKRSDEERARLEDEAAASIDSTRSRDPKSLAPLAGVSIDPTRCVTARDYFDMNLRHSSGQLLDCKIELLIREDAPGRGNSGDVLICEVSSTGRWLLFPPIEHGRISARNGDKEGEIIVMITGIHSGGQKWHELMSLVSQDEQTGFEWVQMLGLQPIPPDLPKVFEPKKDISSMSPGSKLQVSGSPSATPLKSRTPSPREIEVPIGEQAKPKSKTYGVEASRSAGRDTPRQSPPSSVYSADQTRRLSPLMTEEPYFYEKNFPERTADTGRSCASESLLESSRDGASSPTLQRTKAQRRSRHVTLSPTSDTNHRHGHSVSTDHPSPPIQESRPSLYTHSTSSTISSGKDYKVWFPPQESDSDDSPDEANYRVSPKKSTARPPIRDRASSVPSMDPPSVPRTRKSSQPSTPQKTNASHDSSARTMSVPSPKEAPASAPSKLQKRPAGDHTPKIPDYQKDVPPPPPAHRSQKPSGLKSAIASSFTPLIPGFRQHRRSSSPLKHEYEPSTASESSEESDQSGFGDDVSITSESSDGGDLGADLAAPLPPTQGLNKLTKRSPEGSVYSFPNANGTLAPSQSASQAPYRTVPPQAAQASKTIASIFSWSDMGQWEPLHPDECSIVITPGLIEAFELTAAHSQSQHAKNDEPEAPAPDLPLVGLELTPLVPIRRGTALDISIRSPPTATSKVRSGNNILFRSRSAEECEALYHLINRARINNPTYLALQNARGPLADSTWAAAMDRRNSRRPSPGSTTGSWWRDRLGSRASSYRATSSRPAPSESSVGTMTSAFSALRRFTTGGAGIGFTSPGGKLFNLARSTVSSRDGGLSTASASWSSSSGSSTPIGVPPIAGNGGGGSSGSAAAGAGIGGATGSGTIGVPPAQLGITSVKVRLYQRETASKWRDMGSARLTIMQPSSPLPSPAAGPATGSPPRSRNAEKRIVVNGKTKGEVLLDVTLGESCFERVARTGIAVSVWEETRGPNGEWGHVAAKGGVNSARAKVYMIQVSSMFRIICFPIFDRTVKN
ncbi:MAG: hypothetical protein M1821_009930 [Bathelium mastoideum]|nr:MAG: hypothetical protein M1821_009930 [Bathelium mastoideum]